MNVSTSTVPCMNPAHYYKINYTIEGETGYHVYNFYPVQYDASVKSWLSALNNDANADDTDNGNDSFIENEIEKQHPNKEVIITSIGRHMDSEGNCIDPTLPTDPVTINPDYINKGFGYDGKYGFSSPKANLALDYHDTNGDRCFDRSMLARYMIWQFVEKLHQANPDNQVAFTTFAGTSESTYTQEFVTATAAEKTNLRNIILNDRGGAQYTNYAAGLTSAAELFNISLDGTASQNAITGKKIIVFVSDGSPSPEQKDGETWPQAVDRADGSVQAAILKNATNNVEIYAVGVNSGALSYLQKIATDSAHANECDTADEFIAFLNAIMGNVLKEKAVTLTDTLGDGYSLLIDGQHPVTLTNGSSAPVIMTSLSELSSKCITYANSKISTTVNVNEKGCRLSFYAKLDDKLCYPDGSGVNEYKTNKNMTYQVGTNTPVSIPVDDKLIVSHTVLTAVKDNGDMKDKTVHPDDIIPYTITLKNSAGFTLNNVEVTDVIPDGTEFVNAYNNGVYNADTNTVTFKAATIEAGQTLTFGFNVKVLDGAGNIHNRANFTVDEAVKPNSNDPDNPISLIAQTNEVINCREIPNVPQTGDAANPLVWALLALLSLACITMMMNRKKA